MCFGKKKYNKRFVIQHVLFTEWIISIVCKYSMFKNIYLKSHRTHVMMTTKLNVVETSWILDWLFYFPSV